MNQLKSNFSIAPGPHMFEVMHPFEDIPQFGIFDDLQELIIDRDVFMKFPYQARLFVDGVDMGRLVDVFTEIM